MLVTRVIHAGIAGRDYAIVAMSKLQADVLEP
jgi:hypothetical protein